MFQPLRNAVEFPAVRIDVAILPGEKDARGFLRQGFLLRKGVSGFDDDHPAQMSLFGDEAPGAGEGRDRSALGRVADALRERFGDDAVGYGRDLRFRDKISDTAPMHKDA